MDSEKYFLVTVISKIEDDSGKTKKIPEKFLIKGFTYTDIEAKVIKEFEGVTFEFEIKSMSDSKIIKVID